MFLLDFLFPKRCVQCRRNGAYICTNCFAYITFIDTIACVVCQRAAIGGVTHPICRTRYGLDGVFPSLVYKGIVKKLVYTFKYPPYLSDLHTTLAELFYEGIIQKEQFYACLEKPSILVPIPLHHSKLRKRGYNQAKKLAEGLSKKLGIPVMDCLERVKNTKTQVGLTKEERQENIKDAFAIKKEYAIKIKEVEQIFLIDDVATSGATLREAAKILKKSGVNYVWGVTLAHGQ